MSRSFPVDGNQGIEAELPTIASQHAQHIDQCWCQRALWTPTAMLQHRKRIDALQLGSCPGGHEDLATAIADTLERHD